MAEKVLTTQEFEKLRQVSLWRGPLFLFLNWGMIAGAFALYLKFNTLWALPLFALFIASRQHALAAFAHEAAHSTLSSHRGLNDFLGRYLAAFPIGVSLRRYRAIHLLHHKKVHTSEDPDRPIYKRYPIEKKQFLKTLLKDFRGGTIFKNLAYFAPLLSPEKDRVKAYPHQSERKALLIYWVSVLTLSLLLGKFSLVFLLWFLPYATILQVLLRIRGAWEHGNVDDTRTVVLNPFLEFFLAPFGLGYHLEHHLYPTIPYYNLPKVHKFVLQKPPQGKICVGLRDALNDLTT